ncbi:MAG: hypothetical protein R3D58_05080 [Saprospiraceae bacterium]|nr:hypothetical protein [Lewinellaceae bacterium]
MNLSITALTTLLLAIFSCETSKRVELIQNENFEINIAQKQTSVLVLFPCYPCDIGHTRREANFLNGINNQGVTTILLNYNRKLFLTETEKINLSKEIRGIFDTYKIKGNNVYFGGFSSGGNIALLIGDYIKSQKTKLNIKGVFAVDAPIDLEQLYYNASNDIALNAHEGAKNEGEFLINLLESEIGNPSIAVNAYKKYAPFLASQNFIGNLSNHKNYKIRLYTEPSPEWHLTYRKREYKHTNSWMNERFFDALIQRGNSFCEIIKTENKGIRANGDIHPHSWSIVEQQSLLEWMR